jgi:hypothetical protein
MVTMTSDVNEHEVHSDAMFICMFDDGYNW